MLLSPFGLFGWPQSTQALNVGMYITWRASNHHWDETKIFRGGDGGLYFPPPKFFYSWILPRSSHLFVLFVLQKKKKWNAAKKNFNFSKFSLPWEFHFLSSLLPPPVLLLPPILLNSHTPCSSRSNVSGRFSFHFAIFCTNWSVITSKDR